MTSITQILSDKRTEWFIDGNEDQIDTKNLITKLIQSNTPLIDVINEIVVNYLQAYSYPAYSFGPKDWELYFKVRVPCDAFGLLESYVELSAKRCPFWPQVTTKKSHMIPVYIPDKICIFDEKENKWKEKPLTLNLFRDLIDKYLKIKEKTSPAYDVIEIFVRLVSPSKAFHKKSYDEIFEQHGNEAVKSIGWRWMTGQVVNDTTDKSFSENSALIENTPLEIIKKDSGKDESIGVGTYSVPDLLETCICILLDDIYRNYPGNKGLSRMSKPLFFTKSQSLTMCATTVKIKDWFSEPKEHYVCAGHFDPQPNEGYLRLHAPEQPTSCIGAAAIRRL
jgi:hypothetical protein